MTKITKKLWIMVLLFFFWKTYTRWFMIEYIYKWKMASCGQRYTPQMRWVLSGCSLSDLWVLYGCSLMIEYRPRLSNTSQSCRWIFESLNVPFTIFWSFSLCCYLCKDTYMVTGNYLNARVFMCECIMLCIHLSQDSPGEKGLSQW